MNICRKIVVLLAAAVAFGCAPEEEEVVIPAMLTAVPSDAMAVISAKCRDCISELDSAHVLRNIGLEKYARTQAALAFCQTSSISPILIVESNVDSAVVGNAGRAGLFILECVEDGRTIFTVSESTMTAIKRHLSTGTSILDAPDFEEAARIVAADDHWAILRNTDISKLLPSGFLDGAYPKRDVARLVRNTCDWTCFRWTGRKDCEVVPVNGDSDSYLANMFKSLKPAPSRLPGILPSATAVAVDLMVEPKSFRKAYVRYLDATQRLQGYESALARIRRETGVDPLKWEASMDVCEVAMVEWEGRKVVLVRPSVSAEPAEPGENGCPGVPGALYGFPFSLEDDSFCARMDGWIISGSENDVRVFLDEERPESFEWPSRPMKAAVYTPDAMASIARENIRIEYDF